MFEVLNMARCVNCSLLLAHPLRRIQLRETTESVVNILRIWISTAVFEDDFICQECLIILERESLNYLKGTVPTRTFGHQQVCLNCGKSTLRARTHIIPLHGPERKFILSCAPSQQAHRLERVCIRCWTNAYKSVRRQGLAALPSESAIETIENLDISSTFSDNEVGISTRQGQDPLNENECIVFCSQCNVEVPHAAGGIQTEPTKVLVANVYHYLEQEYEELKTLYGSVDLTPLSKISERTAKATGVSEATVLQVLKEEEERRTVCQPAEELPKRAARKTTRESNSSKEDDSDENSDVEEQTRPQTPEETETLIVKVEPPEQYEGSEMIYTPFEVKLEPGVVASGSQVDPIAVEIQTEPCVYGGKRTNETPAPDLPATNKGRGRKRQRKDDETTQHTQGLTTARASSSVPTRDVDENSLLAEGAIKTEEIEIQEEGFS